jgi:hypothetical protein
MLGYSWLRQLSQAPASKTKEPPEGGYSCAAWTGSELGPEHGESLDVLHQTKAQAHKRAITANKCARALAQ